MEVVAIDLDISAHWQVGWSDMLHGLVHVLVLSSLQEWTLDDTRVLLGWLKDGDGIICQVEWDDESSLWPSQTFQKNGKDNDNSSCELSLVLFADDAEQDKEDDVNEDEIIWPDMTNNNQEELPEETEIDFLFSF